jgi:hypothetical protein
MTNTYCGKHEWLRGMEKPCPDCAELAVLQEKLDSATKCNCPSPCNAQGCLLKEVQKLRAEVEQVKVALSAANSNVAVFRAKAEAANLHVGRLKEVVEKCQDVLGRFCGESAPIIAHPPNCRFYIELKKKDCNCTAKDVANDVLLSLKACRAVIEKKESV